MAFELISSWRRYGPLIILRADSDTGFARHLRVNNRPHSLDGAHFCTHFSRVDERNDPRSKLHRLWVIFLYRSVTFSVFLVVRIEKCSSCTQEAQVERWSSSAPKLGAQDHSWCQ